MIVLEARDRVGGRVEQVRARRRPAGAARRRGRRPVHTAYLGARRGARADARAELHGGLGERRRTTSSTGVERGDDLPVRERAPSARTTSGSSGSAGELVATVDPDDPWCASRRRAARRAPRSGTWLRVGRRAALRRSGGSRSGRSRSPTARSSTRSLLAELRKSAAVGRAGASTRRSAGSRSRSPRGAPRWRSGSPPGSASASGSASVVERSTVAGRTCRVGLASGEELARGGDRVRAPGSASLPRIDDRRRRRPSGSRSLRRQRNALAAKVVAVYAALGLGRRRRERARGRRARPRLDLAAARGRALRARAAGAARLPARADRATTATRSSATSSSACTARRRARRPRSTIRLWATDPFTRGYVTHWWPGRRAARRPAPRHARAAVLRLRLRPVGRGLHGGRRVAPGAQPQSAALSAPSAAPRLLGGARARAAPSGGRWRRHRRPLLERECAAGCRRSRPSP